MSVDVERAHAADALAAVVVEHERLLAFLNELLVQNVEHLEERCIIGDVLHLACVKMALGFRSVLTPEFQCE